MKYAIGGIIESLENSSKKSRHHFTLFLLIFLFVISFLVLFIRIVGANGGISSLLTDAYTIGIVSGHIFFVLSLSIFIYGILYFIRVKILKKAINLKNVMVIFIIISLLIPIQSSYTEPIISINNNELVVNNGVYAIFTNQPVEQSINVDGANLKIYTSSNDENIEIIGISYLGNGHIRKEKAYKLLEIKKII